MIQTGLRIVNLVFAVLLETAMGFIRLIAVIADGIVPFLGLLNAVYFQDSGPLLQISHRLQPHYVVWSSVFSIAALILGIYWIDQPERNLSHARSTFLTAAGFLLAALLLAVAYPALLTAYDDFLRGTIPQGSAWFWRNLGWSLALILSYSITFSLISLGMTLLAGISYLHFRQRLKLMI